MLPRSLLLLSNVGLLLITIATVATKQCVKFETYNVGLMEAIPYKKVRRVKLVEALKSSTADFLCLQEIWMERDVSYVIKGLQSVFPHHYSAIHAKKDRLRKSVFPIFRKKKSCSVRESLILGGGTTLCVLLNKCLSGGTSYYLAECIASNCKAFLKGRSLRQTCVACVFANAFNSMKDAIRQCSIPKLVDNRLNGPGLLVFSKTDLVDVSYKSYFPHNRMSFDRGYIQADLQNGMTAVCTHLSSNVSGYFEYDLDFGNYFLQQAEEIKTLDTTFHDQDIILLGDLNTGPRNTGSSDPEKNLQGEFAKNYISLLNQGFRSPYIDQIGRCTFCRNNALLKNSPNQVLDHILIKDGFTASGATRLYDNAEDDPPISDHYGIRVEVCTA